MTGFDVGSFHWCVDRVDLGDPVVSQIIRVICRDMTVWPEQLLGRRGAGDAVSPGSYPLSTGPCAEPSRLARIVFARRLAWRAIYERTEWSVENIAQMIGGYAPATVSPWARSWAPFANGQTEWWQRWGHHHVDLLALDTTQLP